MYLYIAGKNYWLPLVPGSFILVMVITYILNAQIGCRLPMDIALLGAAALTAVILLSFFHMANKSRSAGTMLVDWVEGG